MAKCKALTGSAVKGLTGLTISSCALLLERLQVFAETSLWFHRRNIQLLLREVKLRAKTQRQRWRKTEHSFPARVSEPFRESFKLFDDKWCNVKPLEPFILTNSLSILGEVGAGLEHVLYASIDCQCWRVEMWRVDQTMACTLWVTLLLKRSSSYDKLTTDSMVTTT